MSALCVPPKVPPPHVYPQTANLCRLSWSSVSFPYFLEIVGETCGHGHVSDGIGSGGTELSTFMAQEGGALQGGRAAALWVLSSVPQRPVDGEFSQPALPRPLGLPPEEAVGPGSSIRLCWDDRLSGKRHRPRHFCREVSILIWHMPGGSCVPPTPSRAEVSAGAAGGALWALLPDGDDPGTSLLVTVGPLPFDPS